MLVSGVVFGLGKKHCYTCGMEVKGSQYEKFGKYFCSEEHAHQYSREMKRARQLRLSAQTSRFGRAKKENRRSAGGCH